LNQQPNKASSSSADWWSTHYLEGGSAPFLCLRALKVSTVTASCDDDDDDDDDNDDADLTTLSELCPCGYSWVIWYNLSIVCAVLGTQLEGRGLGLLQQAYKLLERVQRRIDAEPPSSAPLSNDVVNDWLLLQLSVYNNEVCIYHALSMYEQSKQSLDRLRATLHSNNTMKMTRATTTVTATVTAAPPLLLGASTTTSPELSESPRRESLVPFFLNLLIFDASQFAPAA
jgi:hypothetical protein